MDLVQGRRSRCGRCGGRRTKVACPKNLIKNNLTIISAYASFLGNDSVTRPTSTCTIDMAHSCSFLPDKFYPTKAFSVDLVPRDCRGYQGRGRLIRPHLSWIINYLKFFGASRRHLWLPDQSKFASYGPGPPWKLCCETSTLSFGRLVLTISSVSFFEHSKFEVLSI